jgi:glutamate 5-kinase
MYVFIGRGGMGAKVDAALRAIDGGVQAVIIAAGGEHEVIDKIIRGEPAGTAFFHTDNFVEAIVSQLPSPSSSKVDTVSTTGISRNASFSDANVNAKSVDENSAPHLTIEEIASRARKGCRQLNRVSEELRTNILLDIATKIKMHEVEILSANALDLEAAEKRYVDSLCLH